MKYFSPLVWTTSRLTNLLEKEVLVTFFCFISSEVAGPRTDRIREQEVWTPVALAFVTPEPLVSSR